MRDKVKNGWHKIVSLYRKYELEVIMLALSYVISFLLICIFWYVFEMFVLGHLNQNGRDTLIALVLSVPTAIPIYMWFYKMTMKKLEKETP